MGYIPDEYTRRARIYPVLIVALPLGLLILAIFPCGLPSSKLICSLFMFSGGAVLLGQIGRDMGVEKESSLFQAWGGKPTTRILCHRHAQNPEILSRRHSKLQKLLPGIKIPTAEEEQIQPDKADRIYENCVAFLREKTHDKKKFPLVFEENCNYGFRRNLWGMKPLGVTTAVIGTTGIAVFVIVKHFAKNAPIPTTAIVCGLGNVLLLLGWLLWFTPKWVKITAVAYAERLLESCENL